MLKNNEFILTIDCTSKELICCIHYNEKTHIHISQQVINENNLLLSTVHKLLKKHELSLQDCLTIGYVSGPGSFTGIRISAAFVQALILPYDIKVVSISRLHLLAMQAYLIFNKKKVFVVLDALRDEVYYGRYIYNSLDSVVLPEEEDKVCYKDNIKIAKDDLVVSDFYNGNNLAEFSYKKYDSAVIKIIDSKIKNNDYVSYQDVMPNYLKMPHISKPNNKK